MAQNNYDIINININININIIIIIIIIIIIKVTRFVRERGWRGRHNRSGVHRSLLPSPVAPRPSAHAATSCHPAAILLPVVPVASLRDGTCAGSGRALALGPR